MPSPTANRGGISDARAQIQTQPAFFFADERSTRDQEAFQGSSLFANKNANAASCDDECACEFADEALGICALTQAEAAELVELKATTAKYVVLLGVRP